MILQSLLNLSFLAMPLIINRGKLKLSNVGSTEQNFNVGDALLISITLIQVIVVIMFH